MDYLPLRLAEIMDDGTIIITNNEQENFNFGVRLVINLTTHRLNISVSPSEPTNAEVLKYRALIRKAGSAATIQLRRFPKMR